MPGRRAVHDKAAFSRYVPRYVQAFPNGFHHRRNIMRIPPCLTLFAALAVPALAEANCYSVYDGQNRLAFQSNVAPIDLSLRIADAMRTRFPGGFLVMIPDESLCREFRASGAVPRFSTTGLANVKTPDNETLQGSPLLRDTRATGYGGELGGTSPAAGDAPSREAVRSGTSVNVRRARP